MCRRRKPNSSSAILSRVPDLRRSIERRSIKDIACEKLALQIASGVLQVGDVLPSERELAAAFRVSRETVRGGMQTLSLHGIIEVSHGARTRVVSADVGAVEIGSPRPRGSTATTSKDPCRAPAGRAQVVADAAELRSTRRSTCSRSRWPSRPHAGRPGALPDLRPRVPHRDLPGLRQPVLGDFVGDLYTYMMDHRRRVMMQPGAIAQSYREHQAVVAALRRRDARLGRGLRPAPGPHLRNDDVDPREGGGRNGFPCRPKGDGRARGRG